MRWLHPDRGSVGPDGFIEVAEETGLIVPVGAWVLHEACCQVATWSREFMLDERFSVAVKLSARQLAQPTLVEQVGAALDLAGVPRGRISLEIAESVLMADTTVEIVQALKSLGVRLSIDDFGTGYSSLGYLKRFPVDTVKVDRSFVDGLGTDPEDSAIVAAVVSLGHALASTSRPKGSRPSASSTSSWRCAATKRKGSCSLGILLRPTSRRCSGRRSITSARSARGPVNAAETRTESPRNLPPSHSRHRLTGR